MGRVSTKEREECCAIIALLHRRNKKAVLERGSWKQSSKRVYKAKLVVVGILQIQRSLRRDREPPISLTSVFVADKECH